MNILEVAGFTCALQASSLATDLRNGFLLEPPLRYFPVPARLLKLKRDTTHLRAFARAHTRLSPAFYRFGGSLRLAALRSPCWKTIRLRFLTTKYKVFRFDP